MYKLIASVTLGLFVAGTAMAGLPTPPGAPPLPPPPKVKVKVGAPPPPPLPGVEVKVEGPSGDQGKHVGKYKGKKMKKTKKPKKH